MYNHFQQNDSRLFAMRWFSRPKFCIKRLKNTPIKDSYGKEKFKRMLSFLFEDKRKRFLTKLSLERNSTLLSSRRSAWPVWNQPRQRSFKRNFRYILYCMVKESEFLKGNYCICKGFIDVSCILTSSWKKNYKMCPHVEIDFIAGDKRSPQS